MNNKEKLKNNIIEVELNDGKKVNANIVFTFEENGDQFILYEIDDVVYGAKLNEDDSLKPIEEDEWELVEKIFNEWNEENSQDEDEWIIWI